MSLQSESASKFDRDVSFKLDTKLCDGAVTLASVWISEAKNVEPEILVKSVLYPNFDQSRDVQHVLNGPDSENVCGAPCQFSHDFLFSRY